MSDQKENNSKWSRKDFLKTAALGTAGLTTAGLSACQPPSEQDGSAPNIQPNKTYRWRLVTTWPPNFPVLDEGCRLLSKWARELSGGRLEIKVYGGGELVPALEAFDAVSSGTAQMGSGASYYWAGKSPAAQFFCAVPFGLNAQQMNTWLHAEGLELWRELYANYNLIPFPAGNTGMQMGGWFNKEINGPEDFKGLKMRMPGLGGKVLEKMGATAVLSPGSELYTNLERGIIDATEWIGPYHDVKMGFPEIAKYYYTPGWQEPGGELELFVNKEAYEELPSDLQAIIDTLAYRLDVWTLSEFEAKNNEYLTKIKEETDVEIRKFSQQTLNKLHEKTKIVLDELIQKDPFSKKVYESYHSFQKDFKQWADISEVMYYDRIRR